MSLRRANLPQADELEVTILGPGYGESCVVHLGDGDWAIVDSCVRKGSKRSLALRYLESLGIEPAQAVRFIVASHWHDDHVRGLATVVDACPKAKFYCSVALRSPEFWSLLSASVPAKTKRTSGVDEFRQIIAILEGRGQRPKWAAPSKRIWSPSSPESAAAWTLSPADGDIMLAFQSFAYINKTFDTPGIKRITDWDHHANQASVVVFIENDETAILLGADMEHIRSFDDRGWHGVLSADGRPQGQALIYKVAHHGSSNGHCQTIWNLKCDSWSDSDGLLIEGETTSIISPWKRGQSQLPTELDIERLSSLSGRLLITQDPSGAFGEVADAKKFLIALKAKYVAPLEPLPGIIRSRKARGSDWRAESVVLH